MLGAADGHGTPVLPGWMYRPLLEWILGFRLQGTVLSSDPCIPKEWKGLKIVTVTAPRATKLRSKIRAGINRGIVSWTLDGAVQADTSAGKPARMSWQMTAFLINVARRNRSFAVVPKADRILFISYI